MEPNEYGRTFALEPEHWWFRAKRALVRDLLGRHGAGDAGRGLDVGCGTGGMLAALTEEKPGWKWTGVDAEPLALSLGAHRAPRLVAASAMALPFPEAAFDAVLCLDVLYHRRVTSDAHALAECHRVLRSGGLLLVTDSAFAWLRSAHDAAVHGARRYSRGEMVALVREAGFQPLRATYAYGLIFPAILAFRLARRLAGRSAGRGSDLFPLPRLVNRALLGVQAMERSWLRRASLPFGSSVVCVARKEGGAATPVRALAMLPAAERPTVSVVLPTYNERAVVLDLIHEILQVLPEAEVLVVDDNSPDRTWEAVEEAFAGSRQVRVLRRLGPRSLPAALAEGVAGTKGEVVVWLDADGSMPAAALPRLLDALEGADVVVASRYALGGQDARRSPLRTVASRAINGLGTLWLGGPVRDWTSGFVAARRTTMLQLPLSPRHAHGEYCIDFLYRARRAGLRLVEVPYRFVDRRAGETKTSPDLRSFARLGLRYLVTIVRLPWVSRREGPGS